jgi:putative lipoic acid-binding regulatory protein
MHTGAMSSEPPERLEFPCDYPIKVMVRAQQGVRGEVDAIVEQYAAPLDRSTVVERPSSQKNFLGITYVINATSPEQIAELFAALKRCPHVMLVL